LALQYFVFFLMTPSLFPPADLQCYAKAFFKVISINSRHSATRAL
jgi:hypothetical protein